MKPDTKKLKNRAVEVAVSKYKADRTDEKGWVKVNGKYIDLTASGHEDWQVAYNIIRQLIRQIEQQ